jgi:transposase-like protein
MAAAGMAAYGWSRANGVSPHSLYRWRDRVAREDARRQPIPGHPPLDRVVSEERARQLLAEWEGSGTNMAEWCRSKGVSSDAMYRWRTKLTPTPLEAPRLVELTVAPLPGPAAETRYEVVIGRCRVVVGADFDDAVLGRLLRVAGAC